MTRWMESQIETRAELDDQMLERAYAELAASVSEPDNGLHIEFDDLDAADSAIRACLAYVGATAGELPEGTLDLEDRIEWLCRPTGTMHRSVRLDAGWQNEAFGAMLGTLDTGEVVALLPRGIRGYCYLDPSSGGRVRVTEGVAAHIGSEAVLFYRPLPAKPLKISDLVEFIFRVFDRSDYLLVLLAAGVVALIGLLPAWANQVAYGVVAPSGQPNLILPIAAMLLGVGVASTLIGACRSMVMNRVATKLDVVTEAATFSRVLSLPSSFFKQYSSGNLASRVANARLLVQTLSSVILGSSLTTIFSIVYIFQIGVFAAQLAIPALLIAVTQAVLTVIATLGAMRYERTTMEASAKLSGDNRPVIIRALPAIIGFVGLLGNIVIYYLAGSTGVSIANYTAFSASYGQVTAAIMSLAGIAGQIARINPMLEMVGPILEATPEISEEKKPVESLTGSIEVSDISFRYDDASPYILQNLSFKVRPGEYVAIVGKSGCGKSTIMRLLLGFETPERGTILYGPHDVSKVDLQSLRRHIGVVMQDGKLFMGDIASNITIATPTATIGDAWEAAETAGIADDIRKMPMGMQTFVTEGGGGISGGQRQRLMIARAVCGRKRILMFDEATSALDNVTQRHVAESLDSLKCTRIVIAHRLSTVRHCDRILVVDGGTIAEEGTFEQLIAKRGLFYELVERQRLDGDD